MNDNIIIEYSPAVHIVTEVLKIKRMMCSNSLTAVKKYMDGYELMVQIVIFTMGSQNWAAHLAAILHFMHISCNVVYNSSNLWTAMTLSVALGKTCLYSPQCLEGWTKHHLQHSHFVAMIVNELSQWAELTGGVGVLIFSKKWVRLASLFFQSKQETILKTNACNKNGPGHFNVVQNTQIKWQKKQSAEIWCLVEMAWTWLKAQTAPQSSLRITNSLKKSLCCGWRIVALMQREMFLRPGNAWYRNKVPDRKIIQ